jgi:glycosyltransferase involved in cell wall biosynthesis
MKGQNLSDIKVVWLIPSMARGFGWLPLLKEFSNIFPDCLVCTGLWPVSQSKDNVDFNLKVVDKTRFLTIGMKDAHYASGIIMPPLGMPFHILKFSPDVILTYGFSIWTVIVLLLKPFTRWRVIIVYEGSTPTVDAKESKFRASGRKLMTKVSNAFITNSHAGKDYLVQFLKAKKELVFVRPYLVPDKSYLSQKKVDVKKLLTDARRPIFLYVGLIIKRKGLKFLIEAFAALKRKGYEDFTLMIIGEGPQRQELEGMIEELGIEKQVKWMGWVNYNSLGYFFDSSDIFVLPTFEDTWGMVVLEAMAFGKPVLCSELAGAREMVKNGESGFTFDPAHDNPEVLSEILRKFIDDPNLIQCMGKKSKKIASSHTPEIVANDLKYIIEFVLGRRERSSMEFNEYPQEQI